MNIKDDKVMIHFNNECGGMSRFTDIQGFEIAGADRVFHPAKAEHFWQPGGGAWDECFVISSPEVKQPVAVRYCFRNFLLGNLGNAGGLPLFPFRTDNWEK
jgi:sialate O-acetylesterase